MDGDQQEEYEQTLLVVREVAAYKIPPRSTSGSYKCGEWLQSDKIWSGRLRVVSVAGKCEIRLEDSNTGELFATCPVEPGKREVTVESVSDSSRYFVLRIDDGRGRHAFIGLGFSERNDAFDFNVALSDHEKYVKREGGLDQDASSQQSSLDLRLKEGETIRINVKTRTSPGAGMVKNAAGGAAAASASMSSTGHMKAPLAPPPGGGRIRSPLPPPPNDNLKNPAAAAAAAAPIAEGTRKPSSNKDAFADLSRLEHALPSSSSSRGAGWAAF